MTNSIGGLDDSENRFYKSDLLPALRFAPSGASLLGLNSNPTPLFSGRYFLQQFDRLGLLAFGLPGDILLYPFLVQPYGRGEISHAPDAVFLKIDVSNEFEFLTQM